MGRTAVSASSQIAADAGAVTADRGGNAVDAALAAAMVSACTDVGIMSPAGSMFVAVWPPGADPVMIDGCAEMPGRGQPREKFGQALIDAEFHYGMPTLQRVGFGSIATPGLFAGLAAASDGYGNLPLSDVFEPAITWAEHGFPLTGAAAEYLGFTHEAIYTWHPESSRILHHANGRPLGEGEIVHVPDLAGSLRRMARDGVDSFYNGELGRRIAAAVQQGGGLLCEADLAAYRVHVRKPLRVPFGEWEVATNPSPSVGGPCLAAMLCLLDADRQPHTDARAVRQLVAAQHAVLRYRSEQLDGRQDELPAKVRHLLELSATGDPHALLEAPSTIHVSAADETGMACSITASAGYGSGVIVPGTGLFLNNSLGEVDLHTHGLGDLEPGMRLQSNMAPSIVRHGDGRVIAIGSPGASRITTAIAQVLWHHIKHHEAMDAAVDWPRLHIEFSPASVDIAFEPGLPVMSQEGFVLRPFAAKDMYFGGTNTAGFTPGEGVTAIGDARRAGCIAYGGGEST